MKNLQTLIKADKITYEYIRRDEEGNVESINRAVNEVSLDVKRGEFIAIVGANGSGKSTLAKNINSLLTATEGAIWVDGFDTSDEEMVWHIRKRAGMVFQNPDNQIISSVVEEDVAFGLENIGTAPEDMPQMVSDALAAVEMEDYKKVLTNKLSGGQKQRIAIAGIIAMNPQCIILDEATAMLEPRGRYEVLETIRALNKMNEMTVILITHNMDEVLYADRVFVMNNGEIKMSGTKEQIFENEQILEECNLELPQIAKLASELRKSGLNIPGGILSIEELVKSICRLY